MTVIGDVMLDRFWSGASRRVSPEAPVPVVSVKGQEDRAGGAGNVAVNLADFGLSVSLVGLCGEMSTRVRYGLAWRRRAFAGM